MHAMMPPSHSAAHRFPLRAATDRPDFRDGSALKECDRHGRVVGRFHCGRLLGRGGFAKCYEVEQNGESFALKVIDRSILQKRETLQKLHSEIAIHRRMKHQNIVNFIRTFQDDWNVYILLEKCSNLTLMDISKRRPRFTVPETQHILLQTLSAVQYMHDQNVIHRDLKLGNMMMDEDMNVKVGDFGLAAELRYDGERKRTICGTPNYIAPEIIDDARDGHSYEVDTWSLGVILYTLLVGEPPFHTSDVKTTYRRIKQCRYQFPPNVEVPESGKELIHRILQSRPDQRPTLIEIRTHPFFSHPPPPSAAPLTLFHNARRHETAGRRETPAPPNAHQPDGNKESREAPVCAQNPPAPPPAAHPRREVLRPISANIAAGRFYTKPVTPPSSSAARGADGNPHPYHHPFQPAQEPPRAPLDDEERHHLTALHDHLHQTLHEMDGHARERLLPNAIPAPFPNTDEAPPAPSVWVTDYANFSAKYGLCYRLQTGHTGVHYNDSTKMVWETITGRVEYYARVKEVVVRGQTQLVHARDQRESFHMDAAPDALQKKVTLIKYFKSYLTRARGVREGVEVVRCSPRAESAPVLLSEPHMMEDMVYVKRWLLTPQAMIFRLSNKTIQVCFHDRAEVILSSESRVVTYTDENGHRVTIPLAAVAARSKEIAARLRYTKDILCELIQNREL